MSEKRNSTINKIFTVLGLILCAIFGVMLICNITIVIKGALNPDTPPSIFDATPLVVQSGSMSGNQPDHIEVGDLIISMKVDADDLKKGDIISFMQNTSVVTHRIVEIHKTKEGKLEFVTKGDANNTKDASSVSEDSIIGKYAYRIPKAGDFVMFLQTPMGMLTFVGLPLLAFILYDIFRRQRNATKTNEKTAEMEAELERLRELANEDSSEEDED